jgi:5'-nucleotidase
MGDRDRPSNVHMADPERVASIVRRIIADGGSNLQVISDFDMTLTRYSVDGRPGYSSHKVLEKCSLLPKSYAEAAKALHQHYYPIEIDPTMSEEQKAPLMVEWWEKAHKALVDANVNKSVFTSAVREALVEFREGVAEMFALAAAKSVHVLVFSAGLKQIIEELFLLKLPGTRISSVFEAVGVARVVANEMIFDDDGNIINFSPELLHTFNKQFGSLPAHIAGIDDFDHYRPNVILMGDSRGDVKMANGYKYENLLKVGFLNLPLESNLQDYMRLFDVVITGDGSMNYLDDILRAL